MTPPTSPAPYRVESIEVHTELPLEYVVVKGEWDQVYPREIGEGVDRGTCEEMAEFMNAAYAAGASSRVPVGGEVIERVKAALDVASREAHGHDGRCGCDLCKIFLMSDFPEVWRSYLEAPTPAPTEAPSDEEVEREAAWLYGIYKGNVTPWARLGTNSKMKYWGMARAVLSRGRGV